VVKLWFLAWCFCGLKKCHFLEIYFLGIPKTGSGPGLSGAASVLVGDGLEEEFGSDLQLARAVEGVVGARGGVEG
jgi:hypothetical protein